MTIRISTKLCKPSTGPSSQEKCVAPQKPRSNAVGRPTKPQPTKATSSLPRPPKPPSPNSRQVAQPAGELAITGAMLQYGPPPRILTQPIPPNLGAWDGFPSEAARFIERDPNAFLFGAIFDRMVVATVAWQGPYRLSKRLGHFDVQRIAKMTAEELVPFIARFGEEPALHRFTNGTAKNLILASQRLVASYGGSAANIWPNGTAASTVVSRLKEFDGISQKLANMTVRLLVTYYGVALSRWEGIDIAVDRHVARVFLRTGLIAGHPGQETYKVPEVRDDIIQSARRLSPSYPGALDEPAFLVGQSYCHENGPSCLGGCPLVRVCPRERMHWGLLGKA